MNQTLIAASTAFMPTMGQTLIIALKTSRITQATRFSVQLQHAGLEQREDQERAAAPAEDVEPVVSEPVHGRRLLAWRASPTSGRVTRDTSQSRPSENADSRSWRE